MNCGRPAEQRLPSEDVDEEEFAEEESIDAVPETAPERGCCAEV